MKILFIITQSEMGGAQRFLLEFAPYLASHGHNISVIAGEGDGELFEELEARIKYQVFGIRYHTHKIKNLVRALRPIKDFFALISILKIIKNEKPDVLFLQSTKAGFLGSIAAKLVKLQTTNYKLQTIYRIGGWSFRDPRVWWMNKILFWMEKLSAPLKDTIIVNSEVDRQIAIDRKIAPAEKIIKIYNGIDASSIHLLSAESARDTIHRTIERSVHRTIDRTMHRTIVGTIANLYATKGIEHLIETANILYNIQYTTHNIQFVVIGEGKERPKLEALIKKYNLQDKFFLVGRMPNASQYLKAFDVFVLPSVKEGFPWVLLEAMVAEIPIIATKVGAVPEIIEDEKDGLLVPPRDSEALAEKITSILESPTLSQKLTTNASERLKQFSLQKMLLESKEII